MSEEINHDRRRFFGTAAVTIGAAQFGLLGSADAHSGKATPADGPVISVPTITLEGDANGAPHPDPASYAKKFSDHYAHRLIKGGIGHNLPQEAPQAFAEAIMEVDGW